MIRRFYDHLLRYALKFGLVGLVGLVVDVALFNVLRLGMLGPALAEPLAAKTVSVAVAIVITWFGNRWWTFREHRRLKDVWLEFSEFVVVALLGMGVALLCLWVSHYVLGFTSLAADNLAANVIGLGLGTLFRFFAYRYWVFAPARARARAAAAPVAVAEPAPVAEALEAPAPGTPGAPFDKLRERDAVAEPTPVAEALEAPAPGTPGAPFDKLRERDPAAEPVAVAEPTPVAEPVEATPRTPSAPVDQLKERSTP